ncbi:hypothetical protein Syun_027770 [Stephania yunnanensis]|uniref:Uncharacterized protein n=1 Tax=Stephania yunnanensis TaxID=152371 RepID=A0AAP0EQ29_9MAGN
MDEKEEKEEKCRTIMWGKQLVRSSLDFLDWLIKEDWLEMIQHTKLNQLQMVWHG